MSRDLVLKFFIKTQNESSDKILIELWSRHEKGQASVAYKSNGRHLEETNFIITLSGATLPVFPKIALKAL